MNTFQIIRKTVPVILAGLVIMTGCRHPAGSTITSGLSYVPVTVAPLHSGPMATRLDLSATTSFLFKASIKAPVTGYIDNLLINQGDAVKKDQLLLTIITKEGSALREDSVHGVDFSGLLKIRATTGGLILSIDHSRGDFVSEGDQLCQIAIQGSFAFILDVPFEQAGLVKLNSPCEILLPDNRVIKGTVKSRFPSMTGNSQTERIIVKSAAQNGLPENLIVKVRILKESVENAVSLPESGILTDETMQDFWVMKLINDSTAVKVRVKTGIRLKDSVQIISPGFNANDRFLVSGNYGLSDTAHVKVLNKPPYGK